MELGVSHEQSLSSPTPIVDNIFDKYNKKLVPIRSLSDHGSNSRAVLPGSCANFRCFPISSDVYKITNRKINPNLTQLAMIVNSLVLLQKLCAVMP